MLKIFRKEVRDMNVMFNGHFIDVKTFYAWQFNRLPCVNFIGELDINKAFTHINERYRYSIVKVYQHCWFDHNPQKMLFNNSIFVLRNDRMMELANDHCMVLFTPGQYDWARQVIRELAAFRAAAPSTRVMGFAREQEVN